MLDMNTSLVSAASEYGTPIKVYDDGMGPLFLYRDAGGYVTVVRAQSWEDAYDIVIDEMPTIDPGDVPEAYGLPNQRVLDIVVRNADESGDGYPELIEGYQYQSNSSGTGIVSLDLSGEELREVDSAALAEVGISVVLETEEDEATS